LSNPRASESLANHNHHHQIGINGGNLFQTFQRNQFPHHHQLHHHHHPQLFQQTPQGISQELGFLRPIRGIPVYQNPPVPFPFPHHQQQPLEASQPSSIANNAASTSSLMRSRFLPRFPAKRSMRAPRMRWTTTLHARFVHAVELLGGHESELHLLSSLPLLLFGFPLFRLTPLPLFFFSFFSFLMKNEFFYTNQTKITTC